MGGLANAGTSLMAGVDDVDGISVAAHPGVSASATFTTIARRVASRDATAAARHRRPQTSVTLNPGSKLRVK